jgi:manganese efflux pump family protein
MVVKIIALVLPLGLDTFATCAALAVGGLSAQRRMRTWMLFTAFEAGMPLVGLAIGRPLGSAIGSAANYVAIAVLLALAVHMLRETEDERAHSALPHRGGLVTVALALSASLDELAIGFTLGLLRLPVLPVIALIAVQAFLISQLGMLVGERIGERVRSGAVRLAGAALLLLATGPLLATLVA